MDIRLMSEIRDDIIYWIAGVVLLAFQILSISWIFNLYPVMSMLVFGEQSSSFLYSGVNSAMWALSPIILPTFANGLIIRRAYRTKNRKTVILFLTIEIIVFVIYLVFIIHMQKVRGGFQI